MQPDPILFPTFDENLRVAFQRESELFVESIMREDRSVVDLNRARPTTRSSTNGWPRTTAFPGYTAAASRKVTLDGRRAGLLGHGGLLTVTSYPNRTSPVLRGKWVLENLLGAPPPAARRPTCPRSPSAGTTASRPRCASCWRCTGGARPARAVMRRWIRSVFALEQFDAIGRWRTTDGNAPIDAHGVMPTGDAFDGLSGLKEMLAGNPEPLVRTVTEKLLAYALGRAIEYHDYPAIRGIVREADADDYRWSSVILGIVRSPAFRMRSTSS